MLTVNPYSLFVRCLVIHMVASSTGSTETVSFIGENAFAGCSSLQGIYYGESTPSAVRGIEANGSGNDVEEVARYNLSGRPCSPNDKGVQIIVYSDFTTRTVISD